MKKTFIDFSKANRTYRNEDGDLFFGFDDEDGNTTWFNEHGDLEDILPTPSVWDWIFDN